MYDQTIPTVGAQLLFTIGVTCALAFELPSVPLNVIDEMIEKARQPLEEEPSPMTITSTEMPAMESQYPMPEQDQYDFNYMDVDFQNNLSRKDYSYNQLKYTDTKDYYGSINKHNYYYSNGIDNKNYYDKHKYQQQQQPLSSTNNQNYYSDKYDNYYNANGHYDKSSNQYPSTATARPFISPLNQTKTDWSSLINK